jgi:hypothetical protein
MEELGSRWLDFNEALGWKILPRKIDFYFSVTKTGEAKYA